MNQHFSLPSEAVQQLHSIIYWFFPLLIILFIWEFVWKVIALWKCGCRNQLGGFCFIAIFNTIGILPIIYLLINKGKEAEK